MKKIKCEHCGSLIDVDLENKCNNCGAPYADNKEYIKYNEEKLQKEKFNNDLKDKVVKTTITTFKVSTIFGIVMFILTFAFIVFVGYKMFKTSRNYNNVLNSTIYDDKSGEKMIKTTMFNSDLELYKGTQNGFFMDKLIDIVINKNSKYKKLSIVVIYNGKTYSNDDELLKLKNEFKMNNSYYVMFNYNDNGYIYLINITSK